MFFSGNKANIKNSELALSLNAHISVSLMKYRLIYYFYWDKKEISFFTDKPTKTDIEFSSNRVVIGKEVTITCSSNGQPKPSFTIIHNGTIHITGIENTYTKQLNWDDAGYYTCVAINKVGSHPSDSKFLDVTVKGDYFSSKLTSFLCLF